MRLKPSAHSTARNPLDEAGVRLDGEADMRTFSLTEARERIEAHNQHSYCDCELADWPNGKVLIIGRSSHCGGTDTSWLGVVSPDDADTLEREGLADGWRRSRTSAFQ